MKSYLDVTFISMIVLNYAVIFGMILFWEFSQSSISIYDHDLTYYKFRLDLLTMVSKKT